MHEVGIMEGALDMARRLMEKRGGNRLRRVHMTIGSLSGVVPEALQSAFLALKDSYAAQDADLDVAWVEAVCNSVSNTLGISMEPLPIAQFSELRTAITEEAHTCTVGGRPGQIDGRD